MAESACTGFRQPALKQSVWIGRDNLFYLRLDQVSPELDRMPVDLTGVTSMELILADTYALQVSKFAVNAPIDWWDATLDPGVVQFQLGAWAEQHPIPEGEYSAQLVVVDGQAPNGYVWIDPDAATLRIEFKDSW